MKDKKDIPENSNTSPHLIELVNVTKTYWVDDPENWVEAGLTNEHSFQLWDHHDAVNLL